MRPPTHHPEDAVVFKRGKLADLPRQPARMRLAMMARKTSTERGLDEIELLLPWYAAGALSAREAKGVERALAGDVALAALYAAIEEEYAAMVDLNENISVPSERAMQKLFAAIDGECPRGPSIALGITFPAAALSSRVVA
jgi:anti-sigma factor RsiW